MNNHSYEQLFICSPIIYSIMYKNKFQICAIYPIPKYCILSDLIPHNITLSCIIHNAITYYTQYNYISIMYISYCYHLSTTYYIINYIIVSHTMQSNILLLCIVLLYLISIHIQPYTTHNTHIKIYLYTNTGLKHIL